MFKKNIFKLVKAMRGVKENFYGYYSDLLATVFSDGLGEIYNTEDGNLLFVGRITNETTLPGDIMSNTEPTFLVLSAFKNADSDLGYVGLVSNSESMFFRINVTYDHGEPKGDSYDDDPQVLKNRSLSLIHNGQILDVLPGTEEERLFKEFLGLSKKTQPLQDLGCFKKVVCIKKEN